jgi:hypothetical protein
MLAFFLNWYQSVSLIGLVALIIVYFALKRRQ